MRDAVPEWRAEPQGSAALTATACSFAFTARQDAEIIFIFPDGRTLWRSNNGIYGRPGERCRCTLEAGKTLVFS